MNAVVQPACSGLSIPLAGHIVTVRMYLQLHLGQMMCLSKGKCSPTIFSEMHSSFCFLFSAGNKGLNWRRHMMGTLSHHLQRSQPIEILCVLVSNKPQLFVWHYEVFNREHSPKQIELKLKVVFYVEASHGHVRLRGQQRATSQGVHCADCIGVGKLTSKYTWNVSGIGYKQAEESFLKPVRKVNSDGIRYREQEDCWPWPAESIGSPRVTCESLSFLNSAPWLLK